MRAVNETTDADGVFVRLSLMTLLFGPNDAGKSRLLRSFGAGFQRPSETPRRARLETLYVELTSSQIESLQQRCHVDAAEGHPVTSALRLGGNVLVEPDTGPLRSFSRQGHGRRGELAWVGWAREVGGLQDRGWDATFDVLSQSRTVALTAAEYSEDGDDEPMLGVDISWCLPADSAFEVLAHANSALHGDRPLVDGEPVPMLTINLEPFTPDGLFETIRLPQSLDGQMPWSDTARQVDRLAEAIADATIWRRFSDDAEYEDDDDEWRRVRAVSTPAAHAVAGGLIESALPSFVSERYRVVSVPAGEDAWHLDLMDRDSGRSFASKDVAEGYRNWVRLSTDVASRQMWKVVELAESVRDDPDEHDEGAWYRRIAALADSDPERSVEHVTALTETWDAIRDGDGVGHGPLSDELSLGAVLGGTRPLVYLLDEPERNLHPQLQRDVAEWLGRTIADLGAQAVLATHSTTFLELDPSIATFNRVSRPRGEPSRVTSFAPTSLSRSDDLAREMGLTRGELLTLQRGFILVEGPTDVAFLQGYAGPRLRRLGLVVVAMHGGAKAKHAPNALLQGALAFTDAPVVLLLDGFDTELLQGRDGSRAAGVDGGDQRSRPAELTWAEQALRTAREAGVRLEARGIGVKDIFHLTDDDTVRALRTGKATARTKRFPGHEEAMRLADDRGVPWKALYRDRWGIDTYDEAIFEQAGFAMSKGADAVRPLEDVIAHFTAAAARGPR
ncbi:AAA family ATPase [Patulibacter minatonensis]|uniref:AAA family ATPase n=1 Tax=Patulibacter minatonensis TaxID=298163 RepID=UPI00146FC124|nr:AAA family ATPase [Patulibacter minatonensis]